MKTANIVEHAGSGFKMPEPLAVQIDEMAKTLPPDFTYQRMAKAVTGDPVFGVLPDGGKTDVSIISTEDPDREREVVLSTGIDRTQFEASRDVFFAHNYEQLPVGKALYVQSSPEGLQAKTRYATRPAGWTSEWLPDAIHSMMQEGMCRGKSIGFIPMAKRTATSEELDRRPDWKGKTIVAKCMMLEYSVAPIPMNPKAMALAVSKCVQNGGLRSAIYAAAKSMGVECDVKELEAAVAEQISAVVKELPADLPPVIETKSAEQLAIETKAAKVAAAMNIVVPILRPDVMQGYQQAMIEKSVHEKVNQAIQDAFARRKGRA